MKEPGLTGKRRSTTIAATPDDGKSQRKRRLEGGGPIRTLISSRPITDPILLFPQNSLPVLLGSSSRRTEPRYNTSYVKKNLLAG